MNMKNILAVILVLCMALSLVACGGNTESTQPQTDPVVTTTEATEPADDGKIAYKVTVVDNAGNPIAGAMVQLCLEACIPAVTNENGVAEFNLAEADYKVSFISAPAGFTVEEAYYFEAGATEMTITLEPAA